ncbi:carbohydrate ABC transporter permease [Naumannella cuiyingiana]|uniref:Multiple sugar transport system permease protein n=1 Tax=Naumannella cuiyingiana TaxID=1347891 RepID=A0A7Z0D766_9ACTN|nr:multiple sugar transport system permease protein [Naumannella cuiyingiana]
MSTTVDTGSEQQRRTSAEEFAELKKPKKSARSRAFQILGILGMAAILIYCVAPFYWMVVSSLRLPTMGRSTDFLPNPPSLANFAGVFAGNNRFGQALLNSLIVSLATTLLTLIFGILGSYALARLRFPLKGVVLGVIIACAMFPGITLLIPLLKMFSGSYPWLPIYWIDTYQALILPSLSFALPLCVWNLTAFFRQMPRELEQAGMVDGATPAQAFRLLILPLAAPGIFTTAIITFIAVWNEFMIALTFGRSADMQTAAVAISKFTGVSGFDTPYGTIMAAGVIVTVPLLIGVLIFQRRIVAGLTSGGVK